MIRFERIYMYKVIIILIHPTGKKLIHYEQNNFPHYIDSFLFGFLFG